MFQLKQPSMALNDPRRSISIPGRLWGTNTYRLRIQMWNTWDIRENEERSHIIDWVATVARRDATGGKLHNLVINCHGAPGWMELGEGFGEEDLDLFQRWQGLIDKIWIIACDVAQIPQAANPGQPTPRDGNVFCSRLAQSARAYVVASTETQCDMMQNVRFGCVPSFEGLVLSYNPSGAPDWSARNRSTWFEPVSGGPAPRCVPMPD